jgi:hypothetical protein
MTTMEQALGGAPPPKPWTGHRGVVPVDESFIASVRAGALVEFSEAPSDEAPRIRGQLVAASDGPEYRWVRLDLDGRDIGRCEVRADEVSALVLRLVNPVLVEDRWAVFDGVVSVRTSMLDYVESPAIAQLTKELLEAIAHHGTATGLPRLTLSERMLALAARIERRQNLQPVKLQNRDRSTAASIAQVQSIGKNPDFDLLGYNKTPTEGAPIVFADYDEAKIPDALLGRKATVTFTKDMTKAPVQFAVVPAGDVMVSHDFNGMPVAGYDAMEAPPGKLRAVAGNGRAAGIQLAYEKGTAAGYMAGLMEEAEMLQISPEAIAAVDRPMLVRIMRHGDVTADIGDKTNSSGMAGFSAVEQAKTDADRVDFAHLSFNEDGTPTLDALTRFVQAMPVAEQAALAPDGSPTNQALDRLMAATFNRAYQNDDLVKLYSQSLDPEIKNVLFGMAQAAGDMAALQGKGEYDIRQFVTDAATMASNAKRSGLPLSRMAEQRDMGMADEANDIATLFAKNARSAKRIADALRGLARAALAQADAEDEDMFGPVEKIKPAALVRDMAGASLLDSVETDALTAKVSALKGLTGLAALRMAAEIRAMTQAMSAPVAPIDGLTSPTPADIIAAQDRVAAAAELDEAARLKRQADAQLLVQQVVPDQRRDTSGDMFAMEKAQATIDARKAGGKAPDGPGLFDSTGRPL